MSKFIPDRVRSDYAADIQAIRDRHGDEAIVDWIERYYASPDVDRDDVRAALQIDYVGTFYELIRAYDVEKPEPDPVEEARQLEMMRLLLDGKEVPENLRKPASWQRQVN
ncbi:hypothetical protein O9X99_02135 [Agrobacterium salinitolerans]|uniref:Uncharacterized protein n=1 Tax=Agrobacterium salinitolerans TaxID=1183413 RepID=A0ABY3BV53_9HYPH|nr:MULTISPECIES: hypothetical protein [Agrobacterium]MCZ7890467.1 hypothetical protein [Agrobacterium salinitolerans]TRA96811.1 hypothetical protein EXN23_00820 [Agrobacterium salinitolerans]